jgi:hypothetical protein
MTKPTLSADYLERSEHLQAALDGNASAYKTIMALAFSPEPSYTALCDGALAALSMDDHRSLLLLLQAGLDIHQRFSGGAPLLTLAAKAGRADCLSMLLERGADATLRDDFSGSTPAHFAAHNRHIACLRALAQSGYPLDEPCRSGGQTPLAQAASQSQLACVCFLIAQGARLDARNFAGEPIAFDCFKSSEPVSLDCVRALYEAGAPLNARDGKGRTALRALAGPIPYAAHPRMNSSNYCSLLAPIPTSPTPKATPPCTPAPGEELP